MTYRRAVLETLLKVTEEGAFANLAVKQGFSDVCPSDVGRSTALLYTTLEHTGYCDHLISHYARGRIRPQIRGVLRLAIAELFFMNTPDHAVCNESVNLVSQIGKSQLKGYVNGVLRSIIRDRDAGRLPPLPGDAVERLAVETGYPQFIIKEHIARFGEASAEGFFKAPAVNACIRAVYPACLADLIPELERFAVQPDPLLPNEAVQASSLEGISDCAAFKEGRITVQSVGAMLACKCLDPHPGEHVLDCCAAPGGKTAYIFDLMERRGKLLAFELHPHRAELIKHTLDRLRINNALLDADTDIVHAFAEQNDLVLTAVRDASVSITELSGCIDAVLCDVPCSGLGGGTKPDARFRRTAESVGELSELQLAILTAASRYLKPGGVLVYSTCTVSYAENEGVIERFLNENEGFELSSLSDHLPERLKRRGAEGSITLMPHVDGAEGFFIARITRKG